ncbi:MAG: hypothetical protein U1E30_01995 [Rhodoblastus sp.]
MLPPSDPHASTQQSGFMADSRGALRSRLESIAAPALLAATFLLMSAFVIIRSMSGG